MKILFHLALFSILAACAPVSTRPFAPDIAAKSSLGTLSREECDNAGGIWAGTPTAEFAACTKLATDAGATCRDHSECILSCLTANDAAPGSRATGTCEGNDAGYGCSQGVANGRASEIFCNDPPTGGPN